MDNKYKLIAFDIDGTILNQEERVCVRLKKVVAKLKQQGYLFTIVSARFPPSALKIAKELGLSDNEPVIGLNGSFITNGSHEVLYSRDFNADVVNQYLPEIGDSIAINYYHGFNWLVTHHNGYTGRELLALGDDFEYIHGQLATVNKITLMGKNAVLINVQQLLSSKTTNLIVAFSHENYLEITTNDISKFTGIKAYADKLHIQTTEIIA
ncbi:MAG: HAD-IIB family hydrolase, partial [Burkholderiales bacterium]|nr:HAD-IIB family hydrolase [Burkholderiales bacterium]